MASAAVPPPQRILAMDGLRGFAVIGIVAMNLVGFGLPDAAYYNPLVAGGDRAVDLAAWAAGFILVDGKMRNLFSLLFGAGILILARRAEARGGDGQDAHLRRMAWLGIFGLAHHYLLWWGDILFQYAVVGTVAWFFVGASRRKLAVCVAALLLAQWLVAGSLAWTIAAMAAAAVDPAAAPDSVRAWQAVAATIGGADQGQVAGQIALHRGGYGDIVGAKLFGAPFAPFTQAALSACETLAMMLAGMIALDSGFLSGRWPRTRYRRVVGWSYGIGLPAMAFLAWTCVTGAFSPVRTLVIVTVAALPFRPLLMLGHAALVLLWITRHDSAMRRRLAAAGRMALTNYLMTSLVMTTLFYGYGAGLYARISRGEMWLLVAAAAIVILAWSRPWLDRFGCGPFEALWRAASRKNIFRGTR